MMMDEIQRCVVCRTSQSDDANILNTDMKFLISKCGHRFCDQCVKREFQHKREIHCPVCAKSIKKNQLQDKTVEELNYTKQVSVRKKVMKDYNKTEEEFETLEAYNDYLEQVEDLIYALIHGSEEEKAGAQKQWKEYRQENLILIATNDAKKAEEERRAVQQLGEEMRVAQERRLLQHFEDAQHEAEVSLQRQQRMEVALGEREEKDVMQLTRSTTAVPIEQPITAEMQAAIMGFQPGVISGPQPVPVQGGLTASSVPDSKMQRQRQQRAGGYNPSLPFERNQKEAWMGILCFVSSPMSR